jgi:hypothetical protein
MHPADQYEAFAKLHGEEGMSAEDIAARFGVTAAVVRQRLKLGAVSPKLRALNRKGEMNLDQLALFAFIVYVAFPARHDRDGGTEARRRSPTSAYRRFVSVRPYSAATA